MSRSPTTRAVAGAPLAASRPGALVSSVALVAVAAARYDFAALTPLAAPSRRAADVAMSVWVASAVGRRAASSLAVAGSPLAVRTACAASVVGPASAALGEAGTTVPDVRASAWCARALPLSTFLSTAAATLRRSSAPGTVLAGAATAARAPRSDTVRPRAPSPGPALWVWGVRVPPAVRSRWSPIARASALAWRRRSRCCSRRRRRRRLAARLVVGAVPASASASRSSLWRGSCPSARSQGPIERRPALSASWELVEEVERERVLRDRLGHRRV
mmetsp:Transcript_17595/g.54562  ORF Transcript_17595/g.54562 Transcript_17595/m.54562 type:complete len:275 (-) Transcript_17595:2759-3583(-)